MSVSLVVLQIEVALDSDLLPSIHYTGKLVY